MCLKIGLKSRQFSPSRRSDFFVGEMGRREWNWFSTALKGQADEPGRQF